MHTGHTPPQDTSPSLRRHITRADVMTATEVAGLLALPKSTVYELARRGELPCARLGRTVRFLRDDVEARLRYE
jgi:excisionase family DNA binding protein